MSKVTRVVDLGEQLVEAVRHVAAFSCDPNDDADFQTAFEMMQRALRVYDGHAGVPSAGTDRVCAAAGCDHPSVTGHSVMTWCDEHLWKDVDTEPAGHAHRWSLSPADRLGDKVVTCDACGESRLWKKGDAPPVENGELVDTEEPDPMDCVLCGLRHSLRLSCKEARDTEGAGALKETGVSFEPEDVRSNLSVAAEGQPSEGGRASATLTFVPTNDGGWEVHDEGGDDGTLLTSGAWERVAGHVAAYIGESADGPETAVQDRHGMVREFQEAIGHPNRSTPSVDVPEAELRAVLVEEEAAEFAAAVRAGDLVEAADAIADVLVVTYGAALCFGIPLDAVFEEVHRTNMQKADGPVREDGKRMKPPGWTPPDVDGVLRAHGWSDDSNRTPS